MNNKDVDCKMHYIKSMYYTEKYHILSVGLE